ncbi:MAG: hypothetical protein AAF988_01830 [Pseudomonadota bacterium]
MSLTDLDFSLNFVWIQATRLKLPCELDGPICPIPSALMANVEDIADKNPTVPVSVWVDIYGIGNHPDRVIDCIQHGVSAPNIVIKPLDGIPAYTVNPLFEKKSVSLSNTFDPLWQQVDLARLYVLRHCLVEEEPTAAIYSDMDRDLTTERHFETCALLNALDTLEDQGIVVGKEWGISNPENQFIGVSKSSLSFLTDTLIPRTAESIHQGKNGWEGHVMALKLHPSRSIFQPIPTIDPNKDIKRAYISEDDARRRSASELRVAV